MKKRSARDAVLGILFIAGYSVCIPLLIPQVRDTLTSVLLGMLQRNPAGLSRWSSFLLKLDVVALAILLGGTLTWIFWRQITSVSDLLGGRGDAALLAPLAIGKNGVARSALVPALFLFIALFGVRLWFIAHKEGLHVDEGASVTIASYNHFGRAGGFPEGKAFTGSQLKEITFWDDPSLFGAIADVGRLWIDNRDPPHTNLYYSLLRLSSIGMKTGDFRHIIWRGCLLNLVFFSLSFFAFYAFVQRSLKDPFLVVTALFLAFGNSASLSAILLLRPYQLQETLFILVGYLFTDALTRILNGERLESRDNVIRSAVILALTFLSGYFAAVLIALLGLILLIASMLKGKISLVIFWSLALIGSLFLTTALYPRYFGGFSSGRASQAVGKFSLDSASGNAAASMQAFVNLLATHLFMIPVIALMAIQAGNGFATRKKTPKPSVLAPLALIGGAALLWSAAAIYLGPYKILRYVLAAFPLMAVGIAALLTVGNRKFSRVVAVLLSMTVGVFLIVDVLAVKMPIQGYPRVENLFKGKATRDGQAYATGLPTVVINSHRFKYSDLVPYLDDNGTYYFADNTESARALYASLPRFSVIVEKELIETHDVTAFASNEGLSETGYFAVFKDPDADSLIMLGLTPDGPASDK